VLSMGFSANYNVEGKLNLRLGYNSAKDLSPRLYYNDTYYNVSSKINKDTTYNMRFSFNTVNTRNIKINDIVDEAYILMNDFTIGKQLIPFGSYYTHTASDTFSRAFEETNRIGVTYLSSYYDVFKVQSAIFNNSLEDGLSGVALKLIIIPRTEIVFQQSLLFDQELDGLGAKISRLDIHAMAKLDLKSALVDMEFYRCLAGNNQNAMVFNGALTLVVVNKLLMSFRLEGANGGAANIIGKSGAFIVGLTFNLTPYMDYSVEGSYITKPASTGYTEAVGLMTKLSMIF